MKMIRSLIYAGLFLAGLIAFSAVVNNGMVKLYERINDHALQVK